MPADRMTFSNGTEKMGWKWRNCDRCQKQYDYKAGDWRCDLERAIDDSAWKKGAEISVEASDRIGWRTEPYGHLAPDCAERVLKEDGDAR